MIPENLALAQAMLAADPALAVICGGCACRLVKLIPEILAAARVVTGNRLQSPTPARMVVNPDGSEIPLKTP